LSPVATHLDVLCDAFEEALKSGNALPISQLAASVDEDDRGQLIGLLLEIELEHLLRNGGKISEAEIHSAYPQFSDQVCNAVAAVRKRSDLIQNSAPPDSLRCETNEKVVLRVVSGPLVGRDFPFTGHHTLVVGRSREAQLQLSEDRRLSRFHCRFEIRPPDCVVVDLGSRNGTILNGQSVETSSLVNGDRIHIGDTCLQIEIHPNHSGSAVSTATLLPERCVSEQGDDERGPPDVPEIPGYALERELGHGSMGAVYQARQQSNGRLCAVKLLHPAITSDRRNIQRFVREASVVMKLRHKRIVESIEFGLAGDTPFLVMEHIHQVPLKRATQSASLDDRIRIVAGIMVRVLEGLHYAHSQQIVHRDLKPSNLLVFHSGRKLSVKLADFGLAKNFMNAGFSGFSTSNEICGTISYMPPEQIIDCRNAKPACDIYAAGVCLYYMLSDHLPHEASNVSAQISMILNRKPTPLTDHIADLPAGLSKLVDKALQRDPRKRFDTAEKMLQALLPYARRSSGEVSE